uniref:Protein phosphatase 1 regulatory subunit 3A n=1 Tax=Pelusios castaneus TaxID=367368 RepID=A0A8C8RMU3_9SAUR
MESSEEPSQIRRENLLEVPVLNDSLSEDEDIKDTLKPRFSPLPRRRNSASSEDMEPEAPSTITRKVSFADAFGFDLVSVKEFDTWEVPTTSQNDDLKVEVLNTEEFFLTPLFILPASQEDLLQKVRAEKVLLESVEFPPGITCMKGIIRVLNVSFQKLIYVRMSLDDWLTYYDILAEYVPNSCDGETDQFFFKISLVPPYQRNGAKVEFCIRYETSVGTFWANNDDKNYILLCHKKETVQRVDDASQEEGATDKYIKGCLKTTPKANIPEIVYSHEKDKDVEPHSENVKDINAECNEDNNEDNEKELELLLSQQFTRTRGTSSRDERNLHTTEPVNFPNEAQGLENKLILMETSTDLLRQPVPISSPSENSLHELGEKLHDNKKYSIGYDYSQPLAEEITAGSVNNNKQSLECTEHDESMQLNTCITEALDDNANPAPERHILQTSHLMLASVLPDIDKNEEKAEMIVSKDQVHLRGDIAVNEYAHSDVSIDLSKSQDTEKEVMVKVSKEDYNIDIGKEEREIKLDDLGLIEEQESGDTITPKLAHARGKYITKTQNQTIPSASDNKHETMPLQAGDQMISHDTLGTKEDDPQLFEKRMYNQVNFPTNKSILETDTCQIQVEKSDRMVTDDQSRIVCENQRWNVSGSQLVERENDANITEQIKEQTDGEVMLGMIDKRRYLNVTPTEELFICQETVRCEKSPVAEHGNTEEAEAGTAYIIKTTSETASEKVSASEKAIIAELPQETTLSDRPTEEKETAFDTHEGRNDGSHYTLCQRNTVGVLYDTEFEKESVLGIYNAHEREKLQGEMMSVCNTKEKAFKADHDIGSIPSVKETLWASAVEGKAGFEQNVYSEESPKTSPDPKQYLYSDKAEELQKEESSFGTLSHSCAEDKTKMLPSDTNIVLSYHYENSSATSSEDFVEAITAEAENTEHPYTDLAFKSIDSAASGYYFNPPSDMTGINKNTSAEHKEVPESSDMLVTSDGTERNIGQSFHQAEFRQEKSLGPMILISEPTEETEEASFKTEGLITDEKILNWPDDSQHENQHISDSSDISVQKSEAYSLPNESLVLKHISYRIFYFLLFVVFLVTIYHYDLMVCFALYLFSLYWLYWEGGKSKESVKKE